MTGLVLGLEVVAMQSFYSLFSYRKEAKTDSCAVYQPLVHLLVWDLPPGAGGNKENIEPFKIHSWVDTIEVFLQKEVIAHPQNLRDASKQKHFREILAKGTILFDFWGTNICEDKYHKSVLSKLSNLSCGEVLHNCLAALSWKAILPYQSVICMYITYIPWLLSMKAMISNASTGHGSFD